MPTARIIREYETTVNYVCLVEGIREYNVRFGKMKDGALEYIPFLSKRAAWGFYKKQQKRHELEYKKYKQKCLQLAKKLNA